MIGRPIAQREAWSVGDSGSHRRRGWDCNAAVGRRNASRHVNQSVKSPEAMIFQLRELGRLREQGVLTEEEFAVQKSRLLNRYRLGALSPQTALSGRRRGGRVELRE